MDKVFFSSTGGTGTTYSSGDAITRTTTIFMYDATSTTPICSDEESYTITINTTPDAGTDNSDILCNSAGTTLDLNTLLAGADAGGTWAETSGSGAFTPGTGVFDATGLAAGDYTFTYTVTAVAPCLDDVADFTITVEEEMTAGLDNTDALCNSAGTTLDLNTLLAGADAGGTWAETSGSGAFTPGTGVFDASGLAAGDYTFTYTVTAVAPCVDDVADFSINVNPTPTISAISSLEICNGLDLTIPAFSSDVIGTTYNWNMISGSDLGFGTTGTGNIGTFTAINPGPTSLTSTIEVIPTSPFGCEGDAITFDVTVHPTPLVNFEADTLLGCEGLIVNFTNLSSPTGGNCSWSFGDGNTIDDCGTVSNLYLYSGNYDVTLTVTSLEGCVNSTTINDYITVSPIPEANFNFYPDYLTINNTEVEFENNSYNADSYEWNFGDGSPIMGVENPTHTFPPIAGSNYTITLIAVSDAGCSDTTQKTISVNNEIIFYVPNVFTPDGDDFNEVFLPVITAGVDIYDYHLIIFNRWGEIIFESYNPAYGWDGTYGNMGLVEDGVYVWQIEFGDTITDEKHVHRGHVTILK